MEISRKDIGYTIYSRLEEALRNWIAGFLVKLYGGNWILHIPKGSLDKVKEKGCFNNLQEIEDPRDLLEELELIEITEVVYFENHYLQFIPNGKPDKTTFQDMANRVYDLRNKIAHVKRSFSAIDLDMLIELSYKFIQLSGFPGDDLKCTLDCIKTSPEKIVIKLPSAFQVDDAKGIATKLINNLPQPDYQFDGGFVGRKDDLAKVRDLLLGQIHRVITISGAGGVGKTALAFEICSGILNSDNPNFDALVWMSAKEEELTSGGIEPLEPTFQNYENVLDTILSACGWDDYLSKSVTEKEEGVKVILQGYEKGVLDDIVEKYTTKLSRYPLAMKWVIGQIALGMSVSQAMDKIKEAGADIARFCFDQIYNEYLDEDCRMVLFCLCISDVPLRTGILSHVSKLSLDLMNEALRKLTIASLIIIEHEKTKDGTVETLYRLLSLTRGYLQKNLRPALTYIRAL